MGYQQIEDYGLIGDMHTAALVGMNGSIDWFCFPYFDSPSVFASLLDDKKGGSFKISPVFEDVNFKQFYWPDTNILVSHFLAKQGVAEITDFMPVGLDSQGNKYRQLIRRVKVVRGEYEFRVVCAPAFNYARDDHKLKISDNGACFFSDTLNLGLAVDLDLEADGNIVDTKFTLQQDETLTFVLHEVEDEGDCQSPLSQEESQNFFKATVNYWRDWIEQCTYKGRWREMVHRSALVLKLLTFEPTGAIVAAPTCSLPESPGGERNWDYRYTWIRDAAFTLYGLLRIGITEEAGKFMDWLVNRCNEIDGEGALQVMYKLDGTKELPEETLNHLEGYKQSSPVRIGNAAYKQKQLDIYGELMDSVYLYNKYGVPISYDLWNSLRYLVNWVCDHWQEKDEGVWETRSGKQHFVYSKLMCWVAVDRGIRLSQKRSFPADHERWLKVRDEIYEEIMEKGWNEEIQAFVQHYDSESLDAANLMMPLVFFLSPGDPRMLKTLDSVFKPLNEGGLVSNHLVYRYNLQETADGLPGDEGTFNICTFWLTEALTRAGMKDPDKRADARLLFEEMQGYANHLGLFSEQTGGAGEALGNFPQAFTHLALISAAFNLNRALDGEL